MSKTTKKRVKKRVAKKTGSGTGTGVASGAETGGASSAPVVTFAAENDPAESAEPRRRNYFLRTSEKNDLEVLLTLYSARVPPEGQNGLHKEERVIIEKYNGTKTMASILINLLKDGNYKIVVNYLNHYDLVDDMGTSALYYAAKVGDLTGFRLIYKKTGRGKLLAKNTAGSTVLHTACKHGHVKIIDYILSRKRGRELIPLENINGKRPFEFCSDDFLRENGYRQHLVIDGSSSSGSGSDHVAERHRGTPPPTYDAAGGSVSNSE